MADETSTRETDAVEQKQWRKLRQAPDEALRDQLTRKYLHLVKYVIKRLIAGGTSDHEVVDFDDLYTAGVTGLINAVDNYDPERGVKFVTYAVPRIRGAIIDELRSIDWFSRGLRQQVNELYREFRELEVQLGRTPSESELREQMGLDKRQMGTLMQAASRSAVLSLSEENSSSEEGSLRLSEAIPDTNAPDMRSDLLKEQATTIVEKAVGELPEKERLVITLYYFKEMTLKEIGEALGVTESRVCQIHGQATIRLKARLTDLNEDLGELL